MGFEVLYRDLLPEMILLIGGCVVLLVSGSRAAAVTPRPGGGIQGPVAVLVAVVALVAAWLIGTPGPDVQVPGLWLTPLVYYVRLGGLGVGVMILLCCWRLPVAAERAEFFAMILFSLLGLLLTASANDLVTLFFAIELVSVPTYILVAISREDRRASEAAVKYFFLGALAAAVMVYGFSFLYGALGGHTTLMAAAGEPAMSTAAAASSPTQPLIVIGLLLALIGLFFKLAAVPFHLYAPDVYEGAASPVTGLLGFLPKFAGLVAAIKLLAVFNWNVAPQILWLIWIVAALTMTVGNTVALLQTNVKRMLAYSSIAHSGYMLIGLLVGPLADPGAAISVDGVTALLFYMVVYGAMNLGAFAVLSALTSAGEPVEQLHELDGLSVRYPGLALGMAICCFSLMGFPPTAGLLGKVYIFASAFNVGDTHPFGGPLVVLAIIGVINSAIGAAYYLRIVAACYNKPARTQVAERVDGSALRWGIALCSGLMIVLFLWPAALAGRARPAAAGLHGAPGVAPTLTAANVAADAASP